MKAITKITLIVAILFNLSNKLSAQAIKTDSAHRLIDTVLNYTRQHSLYRKNVNWQNVEDSVRKSAANAVNIKDALPSVQLLYKLLGDHHGFITYGEKTYGWSGNPAVIDPQTHKALNKKVRETNSVTSRLLEKGYGYLLIPNNNPTHRGDVGRIAKQIQDSLLKLDPANLKGLIIDLRVNYGGHMAAVLSGLAPLLGEGKLGAFTYPVNGSSEEWGVKKNKVYAGTDSTDIATVVTQKLSKLKIVLLIGPYTRSSGEAVAISFRGRKSTLLLGEKSGGYTTSNDSFQFTNDIGFFLSTSVEADRMGNLYLENVKPDVEIVGGDNFIELNNDVKIIAALKWLHAK